MGRKPLEMSDEEKKVYTRNRKREWEMNNSDAIFQYRRKSVLQCCYRRASLPTRTTVIKYKFEPHELEPIYQKLIELENEPDSPKSVIPTHLAAGQIV